MGFDTAKLLWQTVNFFILTGIFVLVLFLPARIFKRLKTIEDRLEQINCRLDALEEKQP